MRILAFDTATRATTVALLDAGAGAGEGAVAEARDDPQPGQRPRHTTRLMALIVEVLERAGADWREVQRIAVGVGPGTFTGLRIGVATARALAQALEIPLVGISTLQSLALGGVAAAGGLPGPPTAVLAVLDARRGEAFAAAWPVRDPSAGPWRPLLAPSALAPERLAAAAVDLGLSPLAVGDGAVEFRRVLERAGATIPDDDSRLHRVSAVNHGRLAMCPSPASADEVLPQYLRLPDAELTLRAAQAR